MGVGRWGEAIECLKLRDSGIDTRSIMSPLCFKLPLGPHAPVGPPGPYRPSENLHQLQLTPPAASATLAPSAPTPSSCDWEHTGHHPPHALPSRALCTT